MLFSPWTVYIGNGNYPHVSQCKPLWLMCSFRTSPLKWLLAVVSHLPLAEFLTVVSCLRMLFWDCQSDQTFLKFMMVSRVVFLYSTLLKLQEVEAFRLCQFFRTTRVHRIRFLTLLQYWYYHWHTNTATPSSPHMAEVRSRYKCLWILVSL